MAHPEFRRLTRQRKVILEELRRVKSHPTAAGLFALVQRRLPNISLGTVYRNLELLARSGMIRKLQFAGSVARYDGNTRPHDHVRCVCCGRVDDLPGPAIELPAGSFDRPLGYQILGHELELVGLCPACQSAQDPSAQVSSMAEPEQDESSSGGTREQENPEDDRPVA